MYTDIDKWDCDGCSETVSRKSDRGKLPDGWMTVTCAPVPDSTSGANFHLCESCARRVLEYIGGLTHRD